MPTDCEILILLSAWYHSWPGVSHETVADKRDVDRQYSKVGLVPVINSHKNSDHKSQITNLAPIALYKSNTLLGKGVLKDVGTGKYDVGTPKWAKVKILASRRS